MKIASFNAQRFGLMKVADPDVLSTLVKIVSRYDIIVILEVVDVSGASVKILLKELNRVNTTYHYALQLSSRLGRNRYKEQFLFLYRDDVVDLIDCYQYEDNQVNDVDAFAREPYILHFKPHNTVLKDIVLIPVHTTPWDSEKELDELFDVFCLTCLSQLVEQAEFAEIIKEDAESLEERHETDSVPLVDDIRYHIASNVQTYSAIEEANQKLEALEELLSRINIDC